uniref:ribosomal protein L32 n=1 Tax=Merotricha bacillata TaxID=658122 RepID=UPI002115A2B0|nr:ribosomal protein L32 [Merotricha bacillata]UTE94564.1 ribosomal protein L32 [Merotricha bacillata]
MPVPKKRLSKSKKNSRKAQWYKSAYYEAQKAISQAKSLLTNKSTSFILLKKVDKNNEEEQNSKEKKE